MNKIQEEHAKFQYDEISVKEASSHESVTLKHMKCFSEWIVCNYHTYDFGVNWFKHYENDEQNFTTEQLISEYIKQL